MTKYYGSPIQKNGQKVKIYYIKLKPEKLCIPLLPRCIEFGDKEVNKIIKMWVDGCTMNNLNNVNIRFTSIFLIIFNIFVILNPNLTESKFAFGYPYNIIFGIVFILICLIYLIFSSKKKEKE